MATDKRASTKDIAFEKMIAIHEKAKGGYWLYATLLIVVGLGLLAAALTGFVPWMFGVLVGVVTLAVSILPIRDAIERQERLEGLSVLSEEWTSLTEGGDAAASEREQFLALMRRLYA